jgi:hypothetical protein
MQEGSGSISTKCIEYPNRTITWAGSGFARDRILFGSEDGRLFEAGPEGPVPNALWFKATKESESVNGVALTTRDDAAYLAVSTRAEIVFHRLDKKGMISGSDSFDFGAHDVLATNRGGFLAPLGPGGAASFDPDSNQSMVIRGIETEPQNKHGIPYIYKIVSLGVSSNCQEIFAAACRGEGLGWIYLPPVGAPRLFRLTQTKQRKVDYVDVCSMNSPSHRHALIALGRDSSLRFNLSPLSSDTYKVLDCSALDGTPYKVLAAQGHVFLLTSQGLYILPDQVDRILHGEAVGGAIAARHLSVDAFDFDIALGEWLLILEPRRVMAIPLVQLFKDVEIQHRESIAIPSGPRLPLSAPKVSDDPPSTPVYRDATREWSEMPLELPLASA